MPDFVFEAVSAQGSVLLTRTITLDSRSKAIVRSFDLLRDHGDAERIRVSAQGRPLFDRVRVDGKSRLDFRA